MPESDKSRQSNALLKQRIDELETLLNRKKNTLRQEAAIAPDTDIEHTDIPVLDELASGSDFEDRLPVMEDIIKSKDEFSDVTDRLEQKFTRELEQMVEMIKGNLKQRIVKELRTALEHQDKHRPDNK